MGKKIDAPLTLLNVNCLLTMGNWIEQSSKEKLDIISINNGGSWGDSVTYELVPMQFYGVTIQMKLLGQCMRYWLSKRSRWLDIGRVFFFFFSLFDEQRRSRGKKNAKKKKKKKKRNEVILTDKAWSIRDLRELTSSGTNMRNPPERFSQLVCSLWSQ